MEMMTEGDILFHLELLLRLVVAGVLGAVVGLERKSRFKEAGLRTHFIVALGSALVMLVSKYGFNDLLNDPHTVLDPSRIAAQVVSGIGFLGAGAIIVQRQSVRGLTTAAGLWAVSGIGLCVGAGMYWEGIGATVFVLIALELLDKSQRFLLRRNYEISVKTSHLALLLARLEEQRVRILDIRVKVNDESEAETEVYLQIQYQGPKGQFAGKVVSVIKETPGVKAFHVK